jgi:hypothetical protein
LLVGFTPAASIKVYLAFSNLSAVKVIDAEKIKAFY